MDDDELRRQLERRAGPPAGDIVRHKLLPPVSAAMRARVTEPVASRGPSPVGALVAVASALVLVVGLAVVRPPVSLAPAASGTAGATPSGATSETARPTHAPSPLVEVGCLRVVAAPDASASPAAPLRPRTLVSDRAGLVERCERVENVVVVRADDSAVIHNEDGDPRRLRVTWFGTPCDEAATLVVNGHDGNYSVVVELPENTACEMMRVGHAVVLQVAKPVEASSVTARVVRSTDSAHVPPAPSEQPALITCQRIGPGHERPSSIRWAATVEDVSGDVEGCVLGVLHEDTPAAPDTVLVSNGGESPSRSLFVRWRGDVCNSQVTVRFARAADGYALEVIEQLPTDYHCYSAFEQRRVALTTVEPIAAGDVTAVLRYDPSGRDPGSTPTARPTTAPPDAVGQLATVGCPRTGEPDPIVTILDYSGAVAECFGSEPVDASEDQPPHVSNLEHEHGLLVEWLAGDMCAPDRAQLELWPRTNQDVRLRGLEPKPYLLLIRPDVELTETDCEPAPAAHRVTLALNRPIAAEDVELMLIGDGESLAVDRLVEGPAVLSLGPAVPAVFAGRPVELFAYLYWNGAATTLHGDAPSLTTVTAEQLDGDLYFGPADAGVEERCDGSWPTSDGPMRQALQKRATWSPLEPDAALYPSYLDDPNLSLPPGVWLLTAQSRFRVGSCDGTEVDLQASVVVEVADVPQPAPVACPGSADVEVIDGTGLVRDCSQGESQDGRWEVSVDNPGDERRQLWIQWQSTCVRASRIELLPTRGGYTAVVRTERIEDCIGSPAWHFATLTLSQPVEAATVVGAGHTVEVPVNP